MNTGVRSARPGTAREELRRNWRSVFSRGKSALYVSSLRTLTNTRTVAVSITGFDAIGYSEDQKMVSRGSDFTIVYNDLAPGEVVNFEVALKDATKQVKFVRCCHRGQHEANGRVVESEGGRSDRNSVISRAARCVVRKRSTKDIARDRTPDVERANPNIS